MISEKAQQFIKIHTNRYSNELGSVESESGKRVISYREWIDPENAVSACEIEKLEFMKKAHDFFSLHESDEWVQSRGVVEHFLKFFNDFIKTMEE